MCFANKVPAPLPGRRQSDAMIALLGTIFELELIFLNRMTQHERDYQTAISDFQNVENKLKKSLFSRNLIHIKTEYCVQ